MLLLAVLAAASAAALEPPLVPPGWLKTVVESADRVAGQTESGRSLLAATSLLTLAEGPLPPGRLARYDRRRKALVADPEQVGKALALEFELALLRERARAARDPGIDLYEWEEAAGLLYAQVVFDLGKAVDSFGERVREAGRTALKRDHASLRSEAWAEDSGEAPFDEALAPDAEPARTGWLLAKVTGSRDGLAWALERWAEPGVAWVRLAELEDLLELRGGRLDAVKCRPRARLCMDGGRRVRRELVNAAKTAKSLGLERVRERLGDLSDVKWEALQDELRRWLK